MLSGVLLKDGQFFSVRWELPDVAVAVVAAGQEESHSQNEVEINPIPPKKTQCVHHTSMLCRLP